MFTVWRVASPLYETEPCRPVRSFCHPALVSSIFLPFSLPPTQADDVRGRGQMYIGYVRPVTATRSGRRPPPAAHTQPQPPHQYLVPQGTKWIFPKSMKIRAPPTKGPKYTVQFFVTLTNANNPLTTSRKCPITLVSDPIIKNNC